MATLRIGTRVRNASFGAAVGVVALCSTAGARLLAEPLAVPRVPAEAVSTQASQQAEEPVVAGESLDVLLAAGISALEADDLEAAEERFLAATHAHPEAASAWIALGLLRERQSRDGEALVAVRKTLDLEPEDSSSRLVAGRLLVRLGNRERGLAEIERAIALEPADPQPRLLAALLLRDLGRDEESIAVLEEGWTGAARSAAVAEELVFLHLRSADAGAALRVLTEAEEAGFESPRLTLAQGLALASTSDRRGEAQPWLERALEELPVEAADERFRAHLELAGLLLETSEPDEAVRHLRAADRLQPESDEVLFRLGAALRAAGKLDEAREVLGRFRELQRLSVLPGEPEDSELDRSLAKAQALANQNRLEEALRTLDPLLRANPDDARLLGLTAKVVFSLGHAQEALVFLVKARSLSPGDVELAFLEGVFRMQLGELEAARTALQQAVAIAPDLADGHRLLGRVALDLEEWPEAASSYKRAVTSGNVSSDVRLEYATALDHLGRTAESAEQRQLAAEESPP